MTPKINGQLKEEVQLLRKSGCTSVAMYVSWVANVVLVMKKNGKVIMCVDFRYLNVALPKDQYVMPVDH